MGRAPQAWVLPLALALLFAGCGAAPQHATVTGTVTASPCRPVERIGASPCPGVSGIKVVFQGPSGSTTVVSGAGGFYHARLAPGTYAVEVQAGLAHRPVSVKLKPGESRRLDLSFDSGIR